MMNAVKRSFILSAVVLSAGALVPITALGQSAQPVSAPIALSTAAVEGYWTAERMRDATPMPMPELPGAPPEAAFRGAGPEGPGVIANSGGPGDIPQEQTLEAGEEPPEPTFGTYPFSYTRYRLFPDTTAQYKTFPYRWWGNCSSPVRTGISCAPGPA
jgi:hypothetical protein